MKDAYIIDYIRTPVGKFMGTLSSIRPDNLGAIVIKELMSRNSLLDTSTIEDVLMGCANQAGEDNRNVARMSLLLAGLPHTVGGETVNRLCSSGMATIANAARAIKAGEGEVYVAGGLENMTRGPLVISKPSMAFGRDSQMYDTSFGWRFINKKLEEMWGIDSMGQTAENLAELKNISRQDQDRFALISQQKASVADSNGRFKQEIIAVEIPQKKKDSIIFSKDEFIKPNTTIEILSSLRTAFKENGTVTAGNSSGLNDGAAAALIMSGVAAKKYGLVPKARILASAVAGVEPRIMGIGPVYATKKALQLSNLSLKDIDIIELNEAFASQSLACIRALGLNDDDERINPNGGAIAIGHPLGMSGTRIVGSAMLELQKQNKRYALCTMCVGVGQGYAMIIENMNL